MKTVQPFCLIIKARKSLTIPEDFLSAIRLHATMLPMYLPTKWGWYEPLKHPFEIDNTDSMLENGKASDVWWERRGKDKAEGGFKTWSRSYPNQQHSTIQFDFFDTKYQIELLEYLKVASINSMSDFSFIDSVAKEYFEFAKANFLLPHHSIDRPKTWNFILPTHRLRHWLPDMPWAVVFGSAYVKMFGKERLLTTPAFKVEEIGEDMVFIQLTERMEDIHLKFQEVLGARAKAKEHLGKEYFFNLEKGYSLHPTDLNSGLAKQIEEEKEIAAKAGKVFTVPTFEFLP